MRTGEKIKQLGFSEAGQKIGAPSLAGLAAFAVLVASSSPALALDKVSFGLNWLADPEAGGYYQAVVDGAYAKYGLDVTIQPGSPQSDGGLLLLVGKIDFFQAGDLLGDFLAEQRNVPIVVVAADFQKDPQIFMSHPGVGLDKWTDLPKASTALRERRRRWVLFWLFQRGGFVLLLRLDDQSVGVQLCGQSSSRTISIPRRSSSTNTRSRRGYLTLRAFYGIERRGHFKPNVFLLAASWLFHLLVADRSAARHGGAESGSGATVRQCFGDRVRYHYLYGDNAKANAAIKRANPGMTDGQIAYSIAKLKEYGNRRFGRRAEAPGSAR